MWWTHLIKGQSCACPLFFQQQSVCIMELESPYPGLLGEEHFICLSNHSSGSSLPNSFFRSWCAKRLQLVKGQDWTGQNPGCSKMKPYTCVCCCNICVIPSLMFQFQIIFLTPVAAIKFKIYVFQDIVKCSFTIQCFFLNVILQRKYWHITFINILCRIHCFLFQNWDCQSEIRYKQALNINEQTELLGLFDMK